VSRLTRVLPPAALLTALLGVSACGQTESRRAPNPVVSLAAVPVTQPASPPPPKPFSEETRKAVFQEVLRAEAQANHEATLANPDSDSVGTSTNPDKMVRRVQKRSRVSEALQVRYKSDIAARYGLTDGELAEIVSEGHAKNWPPPTPAPPAGK
jgi:hypothetical protein